jgi:hypothetical protein
VSGIRYCRDDDSKYEKITGGYRPSAASWYILDSRGIMRIRPVEWPKIYCVVWLPWINIDIETLSDHKDEITSMMMRLFASTSNEDSGPNETSRGIQCTIISSFMSLLFLPDAWVWLASRQNLPHLRWPFDFFSIVLVRLHASADDDKWFFLPCLIFKAHRWNFLWSSLWFDYRLFMVVFIFFAGAKRFIAYGLVHTCALR